MPLTHQLGDQSRDVPGVVGAAVVRSFEWQPGVGEGACAIPAFLREYASA